MKIATWNMNSRLLIEKLAIALRSENIDLIVLTEAPDALSLDAISPLTDIGYVLYKYPGCNRVLFVAKSSEVLIPCEQSSYYSIVKMSNIYIIGVHLPSQMFQSINGLKAYLSRMRDHIDEEVGLSSEENIILVGDFNVNPFESPMIDYDGLRATNNSKPSKRIKHLESFSEPYINKTWRLYSRHQNPGTFFYSRPSNSSIDIIDWHYLDQVIISYKLNSEIVADSIYVIEKIQNINLLNCKGRISESDHLPLVYEFERR